MTDKPAIRDPIYDGARKKLWDAVGCLIATGPIEMRLTYAAGHLIHLGPRQIPPSIADEFGAVYAELTKTRLDGPRSVSPEEGEKLAERIFSMFVKVMGGL
jgi:hypothetical protein